MAEKRFKIRKAHSEDIEQLIDLHREGFREEIFYQVPTKYCRRWWEYLLASDAAEVYVAEIETKIAGASVLVVNLEEYYRAKSSFKAPFSIRIATLLSKPNVAKEYFKKLLKTHGILRTPTSDIKFCPDIAGEFTLLDTTVVAKDFRRQGILKELRKRCEERTIELKRSVIFTMVDPFNKAPLEANLKVFKSICVGKSKDGMLFLKKPLVPRHEINIIPK